MSNSHASPEEVILVMKAAKSFKRDYAVTRLGLKGISSYTFRHLLASNLKASEAFDDLAIANALGHRSTRTQRQYGTSRQGKAGGTALVRAEGSEIVRQPIRSLHPEHARAMAERNSPASEPEF